MRRFSHFQRSVLAIFLIMGVSALTPGFSLQGSSGKLQLSVDIKQFRASDQQNRVNVCVAIDREGLAYVNHEKGKRAHYLLKTWLQQGERTALLDSLVDSDYLQAGKKLRAGQSFLYNYPLLLQPGEISVIVQVWDLNAKNSLADTSQFVVKLPAPDDLALSNLILAQKINKAEGEASPFDMRGLRVLPNTRALYGDGLETFAFYAEAYNLQPGDAGYRADYIIEDRAGQQLVKLAGKTRKTQAETAAIHTRFDLSSLRSGEYTFCLAVTDLNSGGTAKMRHPFQVYREAEARKLYLEQQHSAYEKLDSTALVNYFEQVAYIASSEQKTIYSELTDAGKRQFLVTFWQDRDPTPGTAENEFKDDYIRRLARSKLLFSVGGVDGWKTDRGRVLLIYGPPDFINREPASSDVNANEVWEYENLNGLGRADFIFIDMISNGNYQLVHSTYRGELRNDSWQKYLYR